MPIIHPTNHDVDVISDQLNDQLLSHNTVVERSC